jgi:hypothetical protein
MKKKINFKYWLEGYEMFGFDKPKDKEAPREKENPIDAFDFEYLNEMLTKRMVGPLEPTSFHLNEVIWGQGVPGAIRMKVMPQYLVVLERQAHDLAGNLKWYTKRAFQINREGYGGYEEMVAQELLENVEKVYELAPDAPNGEFKDLRGLVLSMADRVRRSIRPVFFFDKILKANENRYLICFNVRGQGVEAPGHSRVEQTQIDVNFYPETGDLRVLSYNIESPVGRTRSWQLQPMNQEFTFLPTQSREEIIEPIAISYRFY